MDIQNGTTMLNEGNDQSSSKQPMTKNLSEAQGEIKLYPLIYEIMESADRAEERVNDYILEDPQRWNQMSWEEQCKIIDQLYAQED